MSAPAAEPERTPSRRFTYMPKGAASSSNLLEDETPESRATMTERRKSVEERLTSMYDPQRASDLDDVHHLVPILSKRGSDDDEGRLSEGFPRAA